MIKELTKEQTARFPEFVEKWLGYGLATGPCDKKAAEKAACEAYKAAGLPAPKHFVWVSGPLKGSELAGRALKAKDYKEFKAMKSGGSTSEGFAVRGYGQFSAGWCSYYDYWFQVCNLECVKPLNGLLELTKHVSMWWAFEEMTVLCERPTIIARDDQNRLHSQTGPCLEYKDDLKFYAFHGTVVPEAWIMGKPTAAEVLSCTNVEQRRAGAEIVGWAKILKDLKSRTIDTDPDPMIGELVEVDLPGAPNSRFLRVMCGTGREFALPVPPTLTTALAANCWTYDLGVDLEQFKGYKVRT